MQEKFQIPGVAAIIEKQHGATHYILIQERVKTNAPEEKGLLEIPAGKIREFENIFDTLRREVLEETGLKVSEIMSEKVSERASQNRYSVLGFEPFFVSQNLAGSYPIMVITFICRATGDLLLKSDESENIHWMATETLHQKLQEHPEKFYPMHISALMKYCEMKSTQLDTHLTEVLQ